MTTIFLVAAAVQTSGSVIPIGTPTSEIGKYAKGMYTANRAQTALPSVAAMTTREKMRFTGLIWSNRVEAPAEFQNGKRVIPKNPSRGGQTVDAYLKTVKNPKELRYSTSKSMGFLVKLPGDEAKLKGFDGRLESSKLFISIRKGKVTGSTLRILTKGG